MNKKYLDLSLEQFLDEITNNEIIYSMFVGKDEIRGTLKQLKELARSSKVEVFDKLNPHLIGLKEKILDNEPSFIEISNYLRKITNDFNLEDMKTTLFDIEVYENMEFKERIIEESENIYKKNKWTIPTIEVKNPIGLPMLPEIYSINDYEQMLKRTHPFDSLSIEYAMSLLKKKIQEKQPENQSKKTDNLHPKIFEGDAFKLFEYLTSQFKDNLTDISFIYHKMYNDKFIHAKQTVFLNWLRDEYELNGIDNQLKTLNNIGFIAKRQTIYTNAKDLYKQNKI